MTNGNKRTNNNRTDAGYTCPSEEASTHGEEVRKVTSGLTRHFWRAFGYLNSRNIVSSLNVALSIYILVTVLFAIVYKQG